MYICLMRHGKAEAYDTEKDDRLRELTGKGRRDVTAVAALARRWWPAGRTQIWTSPLIRACQTTEIVGRRLNPELVQTIEAIGEGNLEALYERIRPASDDTDVLLIVGHQPYLDQWAEAWTGAPVGFKTGSMALFSYDPYDGRFGKGKLLLYIHPTGARLLLRQDQ